MGSGSSKSKLAGVLKETLGDHEQCINCMALSDDGSMLVTGGEDFSARMWSTVTGETECLGLLKGHSGYISAVSMHDTWVVTASSDKTMRKWDMTTLECVFVYTGHSARIIK